MISILQKHDPDRLRHAMACIADSQRPENDLGTRIEAAIQALRYLGQNIDANEGIRHYLAHRYDFPQGLDGTLAYIQELAKDLIAKLGLNDCI